MHFEIVGRITEIEAIAAGPGIRILGVLRKRLRKKCVLQNRER